MFFLHSSLLVSTIYISSESKDKSSHDISNKFSSKKDIPIEHYRKHTLQCAKNMVKCRDCDSMVGYNDMENHRVREPFIFM